MITTTDQIETPSAEMNRVDGASRSTRVPGPLFKDVYTGVVDIDDPQAWETVTAGDKRSFLAHTTDIQTVDQFLSIHSPPVRRGTVAHHQQFVNALGSLQQKPNRA